MSRRILAVAGVVVLALVAVGAFLFWPRGTTEVTESDALDDYRDRGSATTVAPAEEGSSLRTVPLPGVYTYRASGQEDVKLGPLPAETRPFPETITAVVVALGDNCFDVIVKLFEQHTEDTRYCVDDATLTLAAHTKHQKIGPLSPTATMACDPRTLLASSADRHDLACTLELSGGPAAISATLAGTATRGQSEQLTIGGEQLEATPLTIAYKVSGGLSGTWTEVLWLSSEHLPLRIERTLDLSGPATFKETSQLDLESLTPTT